MLTYMQKFIRDHVWAEHPAVFYQQENQGIDKVEHMGKSTILSVTHERIEAFC